MPDLYIITGSNGAGKSTTGSNYLPERIAQQGPVFDGDKLFVEKRKELWRTVKSHKECARLAYEFVMGTFDRLVETALTARRDFVYEGHFPSYATWDFPKRFKEHGYEIHMLFLGLNNVDLSEMRVGLRAKKGGHHVPRYDIENNFYGFSPS